MKLEGLQMPKLVQDKYLGLDENVFKSLSEEERKARSETHGKFTIEPLERGFGVSIGHALRRVLLSFIQGAAIKQVNIEGVHHEMSTIAGVREDVPEIVRNFKEVAIRYRGEEDRVLRVERTAAGTLVAKDLEVDPNIDVMNPDLHIATLDKGASLKMELTVGCGRGYQFAEENKIPDQPIGAIPLDTNYSPILKVHYEIENARVGRRTDYDKLIMEVWTDGSVHPEDAMSQAARILTEHLSIFINFTEESEDPEEKEVDEEAKKIAQTLQMPIEEIELTVRSANCLKAAGITQLKDLVSRTEAEMLQYRNFGRKSLNELQKILEDYNLTWGMDLTPYADIEIDQKADNSLEEEF